MPRNLITGKEIRRPKNVLTGEEIDADFVEEDTSTFADVTEAFSRAFFRGVPIIGPTIERGIEKLESALPESLGGRPLEDIQERGEMLEEEHPVISTGGEVAGSIAGIALAAEAAPVALGTAGTLGTRIIAGTTSGAVIGGADVAARGGDPLTGALFGAGGGAAGVALGGMLGRAFGRFESTPSAQSLRAKASPLFDQAKKAGVVVKGNRYREVVKSVSKKLIEEGLDPQLHPRVSRVLVRLQELAEQDSVDFSQVWTRHRLIGSLAKSPEPDERRLAAILAEDYDKLMVGLRPKDVVKGDPREISNIIPKAKELWHNAKRVQILEDAMSKANVLTGAQDPALAIRTQFRNIANNPKTMRQFTKEQQIQIRKVARGGKLNDILVNLNTLYAPAVGGGLVWAAFEPVSGGALAAGSVAIKLISKSARAREGRLLEEGTRRFIATGKMDMTPSARARAFGSAIGLTSGIEAGR